MGHITRHTPRRIAAVAALIVLSACGGGDDAEPVADAPTADEPAVASEPDDATTALPAPGLVAPAQGAAIAGSDSVVVLDVRTPAEYAEGHLAESDLLLDFNAGEFAASVADLDPDAEYFVYCRSGNRSGQAVAIMRDLGFERVWDLDGGILAWDAAGLPIDN